MLPAHARTGSAGPDPDRYTHQTSVHPGTACMAPAAPSPPRSHRPLGGGPGRAPRAGKDLGRAA
jgi:hypothetical protein